MVLNGFSQAVPAVEENIPFLVTFGKEAEESWGDDDHSQVFFFTLPKDCKKPFFIRVFDPDCGGQHDEENIEFDTYTKFMIFGGEGCISVEDAREPDPVGDYRSGNLLATKTFDRDEKYDDKWYSFGPFNPFEGEYAPKYGGYVFKVIAEGIRGDDGNLYRYFLSTNSEKNIEVEGGNAFTFEYSCRLHQGGEETSHVYPYIDNNVLSLKQYNFDWDGDGHIRVFSKATLAEELKISNDSEWSISNYIIKEEERGTSLDIQFTTSKQKNVNNNNVVFYITNQYGEFLPFYAVPIGGVPVFKGKAKFTAVD
jgi:hypothetical protein